MNIWDATEKVMARMITEGKWEVEWVDYDNNGPIYFIKVGKRRIPDEEHDANVKAISAVPDMIEALQVFIANFEETRMQFNGQPLQIYNCTFELAKSALEKAGINGEHMKGRGK